MNEYDDFPCCGTLHGHVSWEDSLTPPDPDVVVLSTYGILGVGNPNRYPGAFQSEARPVYNTWNYIDLHGNRDDGEWRSDTPLFWVTWNDLTITVPYPKEAVL